MHPGVEDAAEIEGALVREGDYWKVVFDQREFRVRDSKGARYLAELLSRPGVEVPAVQLAAAPGGRRWVARPSEDLGGIEADLGSVLDARAKSAYRRRLHELRAERDEAEAFNDPERAARAQAEYETVAVELASAVGLGGRDRRVGSPGERARLNVTRAIKSAIGHLAEHDGALGEHLAATVLTGRVCVYRPERAVAVSWRVVTRPAKRAPAQKFDPPETRYVESDGVSIAYQVLGGGPRDIVAVPGLISHLDLWWQDATAAAFWRQLSSLGRLIMFDKRDTGLSDSAHGDQTLEQRMDDIRAVMDACGSTSVVLFGYSEGGPMSMLFAVTYPGRVSSLILAGAAARWSSSPDYPCGREADHMLDALEELAAHRWGRGDSIEWYTPSRIGSQRVREGFARWERMAASPSAVRRIIRMIRDIDLRGILEMIRVPTLIIQRLDDRITPPCHGRYLAQHLPQAKYFEPAGDHMLWAGDTDAVFAQVEAFLADAQPPGSRPPRSPHREHRSGRDRELRRHGAGASLRSRAARRRDRDPAANRRSHRRARDRRSRCAGSGGQDRGQRRGPRRAR